MINKTNLAFLSNFESPKKRNSTSVLFSLIVLTLGIEYFGYESIITVFRLIILPLSVYLSCNLFGRSIHTPGGISIILMCAFLLIVTASTILLSGVSGVTSALSFLFIVPFVCAIGSCLSLHIRIPYSKIFFWWVIPHLLVFILFPDLAFHGWSDRFKGLHGDSNFCGMYITFSFISCVFLLMKEKSRHWKFSALIFILVDGYLIMRTQSRTTLATCAFGSFLLLFFLVKKPLFRIVSTILCIFSIVFVWGYAQSLDKYAGAYDSPIDNALVRFSPKNLEGGSGREERYLNNFERIFSDGVIVPVGYADIDDQSGSNFSHSSWIDLLLAGGGVFGGIFLLFVNGCAIVVGIKSFYNKYSDEHLLLNAICLELWCYSMAFSMITGKLFWFAVTGICVSAFLKTTRTIFTQPFNRMHNETLHYYSRL